MKDLVAIILGAGEGKRMKSETPKVLHKVSGVPLLGHVLDLLDDLYVCDKVVVLGHGKEKVQSYVEERKVPWVFQEKQLGTGHAVMMARDYIKKTVLILYGDAPLIESKTLNGFLNYHKENRFAATVMTSYIDDPYGYGRIIRDAEDMVSGIVEEKDSSKEEKLISEINSGIIVIDGELLNKYLNEIKNENVQNEYYLTDVIGLLADNGHKVGGFVVKNSDEIMGVNSRSQLAYADTVLQNRIKSKLMDEGVTIRGGESVYIEKYVEIQNDTVIMPGTVLKGKTKIGKNCSIGPNSEILNSEILDNVDVKNSTLIESFVDSGTKIGPYAYLRPNSQVGKNVKIGDFVEIKNSNIGDETKISHLTYVGDGDVGKNVNIGCGVVFVNYNGKEKNRTVVEDDCFIGCNVNLIAPITVEKNAYVAAGSTITRDIPESSLGVARAKQSNIEKWVERRGLYVGGGKNAK